MQRERLIGRWYFSLLVRAAKLFALEFALIKMRWDRIDWADNPALLSNIHTIREAAGMKATKIELIRLARLTLKDIASGHISKNARQAVEVLADYQNSAIELLDLTLEEATQEQSNKFLVDSFGFLIWPIFGGSALRY
jgi:hypothetical protein